MNLRNINWKVNDNLFTYIVCMYVGYGISDFHWGKCILICDEGEVYWYPLTCCVRPESLNTTLNTTVDSAMIEAQIEPQIIQTKLAPQQMVENNTDLANSGSVSEKAAEILNGWEGYVQSLCVCLQGKDGPHLCVFQWITFHATGNFVRINKMNS